VRRGIAADLHDEIGSSLTEISILSEVARTGTVDGDPLSAIATLARELVESMSDIVWAVNPARDHLSDLSQRMRRFAINTLSASNTEFRLDLPAPDRDLKLGANLRREVFLIFKEAINNTVKHSGCTQAVVRLTVLPKRLQLRIQDNGRGFDPAATTDGHGLASLRRRAQALDGSLEIESSPGSGAALTLEVPV
jgi:signal transduction histidine kinase